MAFGGVFKKAFTSVRLQKREYNPEQVSIDDIKLPIIFNQYEELRVNIEIKTELKAYKSLGYRFKKEESLLKNEYHAFQISMILKAMKINLDLKVPKNSNFFNEKMLKLDKQTVVGIVSDIIKKYDEEVKVSQSERMLRKELIFNPKEMGYLLYYLSFYQTLEEVKKSNDK